MGNYSATPNGSGGFDITPTGDGPSGGIASIIFTLLFPLILIGGVIFSTIIMDCAVFGVSQFFIGRSGQTANISTFMMAFLLLIPIHLLLGKLFVSKSKIWIKIVWYVYSAINICLPLFAIVLLSTGH